MKCPACNESMEKLVESGIEVDVCSNGCAGIWFDQFEFRKFDEPHETADKLLAVLKPRKTVNSNTRRNCPKCEGIVMMRLFHSPKRVVEIDECPQCGSVWLDHGELTTIRALFPTEEALRQARNAAVQMAMQKEFAYLKKRADETGKLNRFKNFIAWLKRPPY